MIIVEMFPIFVMRRTCGMKSSANRDYWRGPEMFYLHPDLNSLDKGSSSEPQRLLQHQVGTLFEIV